MQKSAACPSSVISSVAPEQHGRPQHRVRRLQQHLALSNSLTNHRGGDETQRLLWLHCQCLQLSCRPAPGLGVDVKLQLELGSGSGFGIRIRALESRRLRRSSSPSVPRFWAPDPCARLTAAYTVTYTGSRMRRDVNEVFRPGGGKSALPLTPSMPRTLQAAARKLRYFAFARCWGVEQWGHAAAGACRRSQFSRRPLTLAAAGIRAMRRDMRIRYACGEVYRHLRRMPR